MEDQFYEFESDEILLATVAKFLDTQLSTKAGTAVYALLQKLSAMVKVAQKNRNIGKKK